MSASQTTTLQDWVDESIPATSATPAKLPRDEFTGRRDVSTYMRKLVITQNITLDGSVEMLDDWFDPQLQDEDLLEESHRQDSQADALLVGRQTFEDFRGYWPKQTDDPTGVTDYLNRVAKYVVSSTMSDPAVGELDRAHRRPGRATTALKSQPGKDIVLTGSISLAHALIAGGVVDEYRLFVYPDGAGPRPPALSRRDRDSER